MEDKNNNICIVPHNVYLTKSQFANVHIQPPQKQSLDAPGGMHFDWFGQYHLFVWINKWKIGK